MSEEGDLPLLQDTEGTLAWAMWNVQYRDIVILDPFNGYYDTFNLTDNTLSDPEVVETLKALLIAAATDPTEGEDSG